MLLAADSVDNVILNTKVKFYSKVENKGVNAKVEQEVNKKKIKTNMKEKSEKGIMTEENDFFLFFLLLYFSEVLVERDELLERAWTTATESI